MESYNIYFICATQYSNLGDLMINKMLIDELCRYGKVYLDASNAPADFKKPLCEHPNVIDLTADHFSVKKLSLINFIKFFKTIKDNRIKLITRSPGPLNGTSKIVRYAFSIINIIARCAGAKVVYFGNCCSEASYSNRPLQSIRTNTIYLRSQVSVNHAKKYLSCPISYIPDMAYLMSPKCATKKLNKVAVDFRLPQDHRDQVIADIKGIVRQFISEGYTVELYYQVKGDRSYAENLYQVLKPLGVTFRDELVWFNDLSYYADKAYVVSNRLHSLLFGAVYGVLPLARISDDSLLSKIEHVFRTSLPKEFSDTIHFNNSIDIHKWITDRDKLYQALCKACAANKLLIESTIQKEFLK